MTPDLDAYLARIGHSGPRAPTLETLVALHTAHVASIPFENLDPLLGRAPGLDPASLQVKLVHGGRGGYCYEHNLLLADALQALGFRLHHLAARVAWGAAEGVLRPRTHMLLAVEIDGHPFIADTGFGGMTLDAPLRLDSTSGQLTPFGHFRLQPVPEGYLLEAAVAGEGWRAMYSFDLQPQQRVDYELTSWYLCHHPESLFRHSLRVARIDGECRLALLDNRLSVYPPRGKAQVQYLQTAAALREALQRRFGIEVGHLEGIEPLLERFAARAPESPHPAEPGGAD